MGGATSSESRDGTAVTGRNWKRIVMPAGVVAQQLPHGWKPGKKFLEFTPSGVVEMIDAKGSADLYKLFKQAVVDEANGYGWMGWKSKKIHEVVLTWQQRFLERGIGVYYCKTLHPATTNRHP